MCLNPISVYNPSKVISLVHGKKFKYSVPCGRCVECRKQKINEWRLRAYHEYLDCIAKGGYMLFDTLTFDNKNIPWIHDHMPSAKFTMFDGFAFDRQKLKKFLKLLRIRLYRAGFKIDGDLRYFISSEFGTDPTKTQRSHHHVLLFCTNPYISPRLLSLFVSDCWKYGRTDGVYYRGSVHFDNHNVFRGLDKACLLAMNYVSKYVGKDPVFQQKIHNRLVQLMNIEHNSNVWQSTFSGRRKLEKLERECNAFHVESKNFGLGLLKRVPFKELVTNNYAVLPTFDNGLSIKVSLPMYYKRKLFYEQFMFNGSRYWRPNALGRKYLSKNITKQIDNLERRYKDWYNNIDYYLNGDNRKFVKNLLDGRSFRDLAVYRICFKDRILGSHFGLNSNRIIKDSFAASSFDYKSLLAFNKAVFAYNTRFDVGRFRKPFVSKVYFGDSKYFSDQVVKFDYVLDSRLFYNDFCCNDHYDFQFRNFDELLDLIDESIRINSQILEIKDYNDSLQKERYKMIGMLK